MCLQATLIDMSDVLYYALLTAIVLVLCVFAFGAFMLAHELSKEHKEQEKGRKQ
jgi:H+/gluconate symporter-like permease